MSPAHRRRVLVGAVAAALLAATAAPAPVPVRFPEAPAHGFLAVYDAGGSTLAHGELIQWMEGAVVASDVVIRFTDGSLYDELVRFTQRPVFRLTSYHLTQHGPSFTESIDAEFDRSGQYRVRRRPKPDAPEENEDGHVDVPEDVSNGMASILLKNLEPAGSATTHMLAFRPKPLVLETELRREGDDRFYVGPETKTATRFLIRPRVGGLMGAAATVAGKQPSERRMWIVPGPAPALVKFEGPLYEHGPTWRIELATPRWPDSHSSAGR